MMDAASWDRSPILIVDDDMDDLDLFKAAAETIGLHRKVLCFENGEDLITHLTACDESPFLILCDVNLPKRNGFDVRQQIIGDSALRYKSVPFIFWSTESSDRQIQDAYDSMSQGFFVKPPSFNGICDMLRSIEQYWSLSQHPK